MLSNESTKLNHLILSVNPFRDEGGSIIAKALMSNRALTVVEMRDTEMRNEAAKEIAESLKINKKVTHLDIGWNLFSPTYIGQIEK